MKFRGVMWDIAALRDFMNISNSLSKLSKECIIRITQDKVYYIMSTCDAGPKQPFVWCEMLVNYYFKEYTMEGATTEYNEIYLSIDIALLAKAVSTLKVHAKSLKLKLTNKEFPCLTLDIEQVTDQNIQNRHCVHDIPVEVIPRSQWVDYKEPSFNEFHVSMMMPNLKSLKNIVERMKNINNSLVFSANKNGRLTLKIRTNTVTTSAHFPDLNVCSFSDDLDSDASDVGDDERAVTAVIDAKKFLGFLSGMHTTNFRTVCSIVHGRMVKLHMEQPGSVSLQCYLTELSS